EFNARFGDPETQVVLPRMQSDFGGFIDAVLKDEIYELVWNDKAMLGVVIAADGYPGNVEKGAPLPELGKLSHTEITHAGTRLIDGRFTANGGRILLITATGDSIAEAQKNVYQQIAAVDWPGFFYRSDIGWRAK